MKYLFLGITFIFHLIAIRLISSVLDNTGLYLLIFGAVFLGGFFMLVHPNIEQKIIKDIGWGMAYGSVLIMLIWFGFLLLFAFNFFKLY